MKKLLALAFVLSVSCSYALAGSKWIPTTVTEDSSVGTGSCVIYDSNYYWNGVVAGSSMVIKNSTTAVGDAVFTIVADTTAGSRQMSHLSKNLAVDTGIYVDVNKSTGTFGVELFYQCF